MSPFGPVPNKHPNLVQKMKSNRDPGTGANDDFPRADNALD